MAIPHWGYTKLGETYFVTANAVEQKRFLQSHRMACLSVEKTKSQEPRAKS